MPAMQTEKSPGRAVGVQPRLQGPEHLRRRPRSGGTRRLLRRQFVRKRIREVFFFVLLVSVSLGMAYVVSRYEPTVTQME